ncbi:adenosine 3'-phospho 5'-phosphosulfate transporter 2 [Pelomyxa schiedti]|nr:adenosine 3'-phospho 5'-phosphosulfate transporter 2 [Pelomyxa schiedti]
MMVDATGDAGVVVLLAGGDHHNPPAPSSSSSSSAPPSPAADTAVWNRGDSSTGTTGATASAIGTAVAKLGQGLAAAGHAGLQVGDGTKTVAILICCLFASFCLVILLQESIFKNNRFEYGGFVTVVHFTIFVSFGLLERLGHNYWPLSLLNLDLINDYTSRKAPLWYHVRVAFFSVSGFALSAYSLRFLNFPTWLLFKSARVVITMLGGLFIQKKRYTIREYGSVFLIAIGLTVVTMADINAMPTFNFFGILLISLTLIMNACQDNSQEKGMRDYGVTENELVVYSFGIGAIMILPWLFLSNELFTALSVIAVKKFVLLEIVVAGLLAYFGTVCVLMLVKRTSALTAVITTSCRKAMSLFLSFLLFSKPFTFPYLAGAAVVFAGVVLNIKYKPKQSHTATATTPSTNTQQQLP